MTSSSPLPDYYQRYFRLYLRFTIVMIVAGLLIGVIFQESSRKTPFSDVLTAGIHLETILPLALIHGHVFMFGVLMPLALVLMLYLAHALGYEPISEKKLRLGTWHYLPASVVAILLMLYKGYHFQLGVRGGQLDFATLDQTFFWGNHILRAVVYGLTHTVLAVGLCLITFPLWKRLKAKSS